ncbi:myosin-binding protein 2-like [Iris pallida]|uniref:Myosin-binding protein 2-like n=1 Tax=Iris pallida TaxID=29817 RepID=A0AAX6FIL3_IRIPA|nr:myosin-binding protein 2-like [Iris pallida]
MDVEANYEVSIGSEICDQDEPIDLPHHLNQPPVFVQCSESQPPLAFVQCLESYEETTEKEAASELTMFEAERVNEYEETTEKRGVSELRVFEAEPVDETLARVAHRNLSICPELISEVEEERAPETPTSVDSFNAMHKRFREFGTESLDGSVASEIDGSELLTVDHLKAALKSERKTLSALYSELEEERSASSIAANQTMAMITRLQEEKAAMQMEAFQYQRMMEEQSEYDQEALQLLNDLVMKREREKQELEEELEAYRKKVLAYEAKERRGVAAVTNGRSQTSSALSTGDESNDLSSESHDGEDCDYNQNESHQNTPVSDALCFATDHEAAKHLLTLDDSLADFEEERFSILEQLKALEEKLLSLDDDDDNSKIINGLGHHFPDENGHGVNGDYESCGDNVNGFVNDSDSNGKLHDKPRSAPAGGKSLLPLFDATVSVESEDGLSMNLDAMDGSPDSLSKSTLHNHKKLAIAEEVDNIYERLQALEGDREFIKHCISSMRKGDKGMDLLQEILQHLRDLRSVQLRVRNAGYALASLSA